MIFDKNLAVLHAYLCADGYVIKNPATQKRTYYTIDLRNTNEELLLDFQNKFYDFFKIKPHLYHCQRCKIGSKEIYTYLINTFGSFHSREWTFPLIKEELIPFWLRTFFDCEGWVFCKNHQNRHIGVDSINEKGIDRIKAELRKLGIETIKKYNKKRKIFRLLIYGKANLKKFKEKIDFFHPVKKSKLERAINNYIDYFWKLNDIKEVKILC